MSVKNNRIWYFVAMLPLLVAVSGIMFLTLFFYSKLIKDPKLFIIVAFSFAEITMILAGLGGISYLIDSSRTPQMRRLMIINTVLFFLAAFTGLLLFMQI